MNSASALGFVRARVESMAVGRDRPRPGALHISSLADAGFDGRPLVFIVGLQEGGMFPSAVEDAVLLDSERETVSPLLRTSVGQLDEAVCEAAVADRGPGRVGGAVCLSFSCRDTRQFRDSFPSWIVLQAFRLMRGDASLTYEHLAKWLGEPKSAVPASPDAAPTEAAWWLAGAAKKGARAPVLAAFPPLAGGIRAEEARATDEFTAYDGHVPAAGPVLDASQNARGTSATTLERAATCPFRHFLREGLGVRPIEEGRQDADVWLDPLTKGTELHELFARFMRAMREAKRRPNLKRDLDRLRAWGQERLARSRRRCRRHRTRSTRGSRGSSWTISRRSSWPNARDATGPIPSASRSRSAFRQTMRRASRWRARSRSCSTSAASAGSSCTGESIASIASAAASTRWWTTRPAASGPTTGRGVRGRHAPSARHLRAAAGRFLKAIDPKARVTRARYLFPAVKGRGRFKSIPAPPRRSPSRSCAIWPTSSARAPSCRQTTRMRASGATSRPPAARMPPRRRPGSGTTPTTRCSSPIGGSAAMSKKRKTPADQPVRDRIVSEFDRNFLVEAGAGSGKTYSLAMRMAAGIEAGRYTVEHMAAVTFTRKAAAELRGRFQLALEERLRANPRADAERRLEAALSGIERLFAGTIHAFCAHLLRERPVDARIAPGFVELDDVEDVRLRERSWRNFVNAARARGFAPLLDLLDAGVKPKDLDEAFAAVCEHEDVAFDMGSGDAPALDPVLQRGRALLEGARQAEARRVPRRDEVQGPAQLRRVRQPDAGRAAHQVGCAAGRPADVLEQQGPHPEVVGREGGPRRRRTPRRRSRVTTPFTQRSWSRSS